MNFANLILTGLFSIGEHMDIKTLSTKEQVLLAMNRVYSNSLTTTSGGNISAMDGTREGIFLLPRAV